MRIVQINTFPYKATGSIMMNIHNKLLEEQYDSYVVWGRGRAAQNEHEIAIRDEFGVKFHGIYTRITDKTGFASKKMTRKLIDKLKQIEPDILHLHNIHGFGFWFQYKVRGMSFKYIISLGTQGVFSTENTTSASINFILNFSYSSIVPWLYLLFYYDNKIVKVATTFFMTTLFIICGWRNVIIIMALAAICMYFIKNEKRPTMKQITLVIAIGLIFLGILGATRGSLRTGEKVDDSAFEMKNVIDSVGYSLETNFNLYQPFYAIATNYPSRHMYSFGKAIFWDTLVTIIPRVIWPSKPQAWNNSLNTAMRISTNDIVVTKYGMAVPSIGEYYVDFGFCGTVLFCFLMGIVLKRQVRFYRKKDRSIEDLIRYSITYGVLFVLVMRGATPNNFYYLIFLIWPNWVVKYISAKGKRMKICSI